MMTRLGQDPRFTVRQRGSGLLLRVLVGLRGTDLGFNPAGILTSEIFLSPAGYEGRDTSTNFYRPLLEKSRALPGVRAAGLNQVPSIHNWGWNGDMHIVGHPPDPPNQERLAETRFVTPSYFNVLGISLIRGPMLDERFDTHASQPVVVVNEKFVNKFLSEGEDLIGEYVEGWMVKVIFVGVLDPTKALSAAHGGDGFFHLSTSNPRPVDGDL